MHRDMEQKWNNFGETSPGCCWKVSRKGSSCFVYFRARYVYTRAFRMDNTDFVYSS